MKHTQEMLRRNMNIMTVFLLAVMLWIILPVPQKLLSTPVVKIQPCK